MICLAGGYFGFGEDGGGGADADLVAVDVLGAEDVWDVDDGKILLA